MTKEKTTITLDKKIKEKAMIESDKRGWSLSAFTTHLYYMFFENIKETKSDK